MNKYGNAKPLSKVKSNSAVPFLTAAAYPGAHCPMHTSLAICAKLKGLSTIVIGTAECGAYSRNIVQHDSVDKAARHWVYALDSKEVVFGCRNGIIEAIKEIVKDGAKALMLIATCVPEVIGEDIEGIVFEMQPQLDIPLSYVSLPHFKCNSFPSGYWKTIAAFADFMQPQARNPKVVNILGRSSSNKHRQEPSLLRELSKRGYTLKLLGPDAVLADFVNAPSAALNLVVSPYMNSLAKVMQKKFKLPFISLHEIYSVSELDTVYGDIADVLQMSWGRSWEDERTRALGLEATMQSKLSGLQYVMSYIGVTMTLPMVKYLADFNMQPLLLHMEEFYPDDIIWRQKLLELGIDPYVCHMVNEKADCKIIKELAPDFYFGDLLKEYQNFKGVPFLFDLYQQLGYERSISLLERIQSAL